MLLPSEAIWGKSEGLASICNNEELEHDDEKPDEHEWPVSGDAREEVELIMDLAAANHVPDLHDDEEVEDEGDVARVLISILLADRVPEWLSTNVKLTAWSNAAVFWIRLFGEELRHVMALIPLVFFHWLVDEVLSEEDDDEDEDELVDGHVEDVLGHFARDDVVILSLGRTLQQVGLGVLGGKSKSSQRVHDEVHPKKLDSLQRSSLHQSGANEHSDQGIDVHGELEL